VARKKSQNLTEAELRLMDIIWKKAPTTVAEVVEALPPESGLAYSTVLTTMRILENKGYIRHNKQGRAFVYEPVVEREEASRNAVRYLVSRFFNGSPTLLVQNLLKDEELSAKELDRLRTMIADRE
jgi:predicted transcriptional regulator